MSKIYQGEAISGTNKKGGTNWTKYLYLIGGSIALIRGLILLAHIAVGLILVLVGSTLINQFLSKK